MMRSVLLIISAVMSLGYIQKIAGIEVVEPEVMALPTLSEEMEKQIEEGTLIPGSSLMGRIALEILFSDGEEPPVLDQMIEIPEPEVIEQELPTTISEIFYEGYFRNTPSGYLVDPQNLLTAQEKGDREGFFEDHAKDSSVDIYFYLFDTYQQLPEGESPQRVMFEHVQKLGPSLVVFYYFGMPERTQMVFSPQLERLVKDMNQRTNLVLAAEDGLDDSPELAQIDRFCIQLSTELFKIENTLGTLEQENSNLMHPLSEEAPEVFEEPRLFDFFWNSSFARNVLGVLGLIILAGGVGFIVKKFVDRKRIYVFPESEGSLLLQAPHAAGVGALITYDSPALPPSVQKDEVPDYLQKM